MCYSNTNTHNLTYSTRVWDAANIASGETTLKVSVVILPLVLLDSSVILYGLQDVCHLLPSLVFVLRKIPLQDGSAESDTKVKTHLSWLNKSDKEMLYGLPPEGSPKSRGEQSGRNV